MPLLAVCEPSIVARPPTSPVPTRFPLSRHVSHSSPARPFLTALATVAAVALLVPTVLDGDPVASSTPDRTEAAPAAVTGPHLADVVADRPRADEALVGHGGVLAAEIEPIERAPEPEPEPEPEPVSEAATEPEPEPEPEPESECPPNSSPDCAFTYRQAISTWERLAQCESKGDWGINTGNGYYGGVQFSLQSWQAVGGSGYPHEHSKWVQIHYAEKLHAQQGWGAWPACSRKLGLR